jgi:hypothetical protein
MRRFLTIDGCSFPIISLFIVFTGPVTETPRVKMKRRRALCTVNDSLSLEDERRLCPERSVELTLRMGLTMRINIKE